MTLQERLMLVILMLLWGLVTYLVTESLLAAGVTCAVVLLITLRGIRNA